MKYIIILGDGMADWPSERFGGKTLMQHAFTPNMDKLAQMGRTGCLVTVPEGFHPGSEVANMSVMGYDLSNVYEGRGVLEAASIGVSLQPGDMAMRCNLICIEDGYLTGNTTLDKNGNYTIYLLGSGNDYTAILMDNKLKDSVFTRLFLLGGIGQDSFELCNMQDGVSVWTVK